MKYLLDTHTFLWFIGGNNELSQQAKGVIQKPENAMYLSIASFWEIAIKLSIGKLAIDLSFDELKKEADNNDFRLLPIQFEDTRILTTLELFHKDPFEKSKKKSYIIENRVVCESERPDFFNLY